MTISVAVGLTLCVGSFVTTVLLYYMSVQCSAHCLRHVHVKHATHFAYLPTYSDISYGSIAHYASSYVMFIAWYDFIIHSTVYMFDYT